MAADLISKQEVGQPLETSCATKRSNMFMFHFPQFRAGEPLHAETVKCIETGT